MSKLASTRSRLNFFSVVPVIVLIVFLSVAGINNYYCSNQYSIKGLNGQIPVIEEGKISRGYTLITPLSQNSETNGNNFVYLLDLYGRPVHQWKTEFSGFYSVLRENGNLVTSLISPIDTKNYPSGGRTGIIQELDWNGKLVWEYRHEMLHHDFDIMPNGNIVATIWQKTPKNIAAQVKGGVAGTEFKGDMYDDEIVEINREGKVVWSWKAHDNLDVNLDGLNSQSTRANWTNINGIKYMNKNPIDGGEGYLVSFRAASEVIMISKATGKIIWRSPKGLLGGQHDPTLLENGNVLIFNNNIYQAFSPVPAGSSIIEINPITNEVVWELGNGPKGVEHSKLYSFLVGGAQRLPNGNTLFVDGHKGHLFEVTSDKKIVWDLVSTYKTPALGLFDNTTIFKARRYALSGQIKWPTRLESDLPISASVCKTIDKYI